jgi:hypothetical protein
MASGAPGKAQEPVTFGEDYSPWRVKGSVLGRGFGLRRNPRGWWLLAGQGIALGTVASFAPPQTRRSP